MDPHPNRGSTNAGAHGFRGSMACCLFAYHPFLILQNLISAAKLTERDRAKGMGVVEGKFDRDGDGTVDAWQND
jgi:hypothetical protein